MSLKTWKEEFYKIDADGAADGSWADALDHSLWKWIGFRSENLTKHNMTIRGLRDYSMLSIFSCALCEKAEFPDCKKCIIYKTTGKDCFKEYRECINCFNPEPMIELLAKTLDKEIEI